jgi:hypothetical protein
MRGLTRPDPAKSGMGGNGNLKHRDFRVAAQPESAGRGKPAGHADTWAPAVERQAPPPAKAAVQCAVQHVPQPGIDQSCGVHCGPSNQRARKTDRGLPHLRFYCRVQYTAASYRNASRIPRKSSEWIRRHARRKAKTIALRLTSLHASTHDI